MALGNLMIDRRCPCCNRPVVGREEVVWVKALTTDRKVVKCPHPTCGVAVKVYEYKPPTYGALVVTHREFGYATVPTPSKAVTRS